MSAKIGRNDPCHCGSGQKYKRCCLSADETRGREDYAASRLNDVSPFELAEAIESVPEDPTDTELVQLKQRTRPILNFMRNQAEIQEAGRKLEAHRAEFNTFINDHEAFNARVQSLFAEEAFSPFYFTADEIQRAFESIGFPAKADDDDDRWFQKIEKVILFLLNDDRRSGLAMGLLSLLPHHVNSGRFIDAWIISHLA